MVYTLSCIRAGGREGQGGGVLTRIKGRKCHRDGACTGSNGRVRTSLRR